MFKTEGAQKIDRSLIPDTMQLFEHSQLKYPHFLLHVGKAMIHIVTSPSGPPVATNNLRIHCNSPHLEEWH